MGSTNSALSVRRVKKSKDFGRNAEVFAFYGEEFIFKLKSGCLHGLQDWVKIFFVLLQRSKPEIFILAGFG